MRPFTRFLLRLNPAVLLLLFSMLTGCGTGGTPTRSSDFRGPSTDTVAELSSTVVVSSTPHGEPTSDSAGSVEITMPLSAVATQPPTPGQLLAEPTFTAILPQLRVVLNTVNVRAGPGSEFAVVQFLRKDDVVTAIDSNTDGSWHKVLLADGSEGWIGSTVVEVIDVLPAATPTDSPDGTPTTMAVLQEDVEVATATPFPPVYVEVFNVSDHVTSQGKLWLYGEVINLGSKPVKRVRLTATMYDQAGLVTAVNDSSADIPLGFSLWHVGVLHPSEYAPFSILIDDPGAYASWRITVTYAEASSSDFAKHYDDLLILNDQGRQTSDLLGNYRVTGEIRNTGTHETGPVRIVTTLYDSDGRVIGVDGVSASEFDKLAPGEVTPFSVLLYARGPVASYRLFIRSVRHD